jgi:hypothetical protein
MSTVVYALPAVSTLNGAIRRFDRNPRTSLGRGHTSTANSSSIGAFSIDEHPNSPPQQEIGYGGELFVSIHLIYRIASSSIANDRWLIFRLFREKFHATEEFWTSKMRDGAGLSPFTEDEGDYSDFTVIDGTVTARITDWLIQNGHTAARC